MNHTILMIENDRFKKHNVKAFLQDCGYGVKVVQLAEQAICSLKDSLACVLLVDMGAERIGNGDLIRAFLTVSPSLEIIVVGAHLTVKDAVCLIKSGTFDCFDENVTEEELLASIQQAVEKRMLPGVTSGRPGRPAAEQYPDGIVYESGKMKAIVSVIDRVADSNATILLLGESGVGKEVIAKSIHNKSSRKEKRFVVINCAAIPENLIESELFGHEKGSFTGASYKKIGKFEQAEGGTVFLDEMGELSLDMQVKFLRVLQERQMERLGSSNCIRLDVRIIAATNRDLASELKNGNFREDLYYRINVVKIDIPPLRERKEDIGAMAMVFLKEFSREYGKKLCLIDIEVMYILLNCQWNGNVRELKNVMERSVVMAYKDEEILSKDHLPMELLEDNPIFFRDTARTEITLREYEKLIILYTLNKVNGNKTKAADILDIKRQTLYNKIKEYNLI